MSEFGGLWNMKITSMHLYPRRWNVAAQVAEELKIVTYATPPMEELRRFFFCLFKRDWRNTIRYVPCYSLGRDKRVFFMFLIFFHLAYYTLKKMNDKIIMQCLLLQQTMHRFTLFEWIVHMYAHTQMHTETHTRTCTHTVAQHACTHICTHPHI